MITDDQGSFELTRFYVYFTTIASYVQIGSFKLYTSPTSQLVAEYCGMLGSWIVEEELEGRVWHVFHICTFFVYLVVSQAGDHKNTIWPYCSCNYNIPNHHILSLLMWVIETIISSNCQLGFVAYMR